MFFQMTQIMTIMEDFLAMQGYAYLRLDGSTKAEDRTDLLRRFNAPDSPYFVFLLSTRAGGLGLNLQSADTVIIFDSDWNPHQDLQAQDRAHRIGQTKEVRIFRLITSESVEEYILERAQHKLNLDCKIIQAGKFDHKSTNEERDAMLRAIIEREAEKNDVEEVYGDDELNEIIARDDDELETFRKLDEERERLEQQRAEKMGFRLPRLIEASELPKVYLYTVADEDEASGDAEGHEAYSSDLRSSRKRPVSYKEISDAQWLAQIERTDSPQSVAVTAPKKRTKKRAQPLDAAMDGSESEEGSLGSSPAKAPRVNLRFKIPRPVAVASDVVKPDGLDAATRESIVRSIYEAVENCTDETAVGRYRSDLFMELPDRTLYPDYYQLIAHPICLSQIQARLSEYPSVHAFMADLERLFGNALRYNVEGSQVYEDALAMRQLAQDRLEELMASEGRFDSDSASESASESAIEGGEAEREEEEASGTFEDYEEDDNDDPY